MTAGDVASLIAATTAVVALVGGYVQFVLKRSILPSLQFETGFDVHHRGPISTIGEVACKITNTGTNMAVIENMRFRIRYRIVDAADVLREDGLEPMFSNVLVNLKPETEPPEPQRTRRCFLSRRAMRRTDGAGRGPSAVSPTITSTVTDPDSMVGPWWISIVKTRTFIQPGVSQRYTKPVCLPGNTELVDLTAAFDYKIQNGRITNWLIAIFARPPDDLDWRNGVKNHTARRLIPLAVHIAENSPGAVMTAATDGAESSPTPAPPTTSPSTISGAPLV